MIVTTDLKLNQISIDSCCRLRIVFCVFCCVVLICFCSLVRCDALLGLQQKILISIETDQNFRDRQKVYASVELS